MGTVLGDYIGTDPFPHSLLSTREPKQVVGDPKIWKEMQTPPKRVAEEYGYEVMNTWVVLQIRVIQAILCYHPG